jgi:hypothetical protein
MIALEETKTENTKMGPLLIAGHAKIGKSTLAAQIPGAVFISLEGRSSLQHISAKAFFCGTFSDVKDAIKQAIKMDARIIIDTVDALYIMIRAEVLKELEVEHESEVPFGKAYALIEGKWQNLVNVLCKYNAIFLAHIDRIDEKTEKISGIPQKAQNYLLARTDANMKLEKVKKPSDKGGFIEERVLKTNAILGAGSRIVLPATVTIEQFINLY